MKLLNPFEGRACMHYTLLNLNLFLAFNWHLSWIFRKAASGSCRYSKEFGANLRRTNRILSSQKEFGKFKGFDVK
jgi:hypothetical protein